MQIGDPFNFESQAGKIDALKVGGILAAMTILKRTL